MSNVRFEVAFEILPANVPGAADWTDLTDKLTQPLTTTPNGTAQIVLEDYARTHDPTAEGTQGLVRHARLIGVANSTDYPLWRGLVDTWDPRWAVGSVLTDVELVDGLAWCALQDDDIDLPRQYSHERIAALLDLAGWPEALRDIGDGVVLLEPFDQIGANLVRQMEDATKAEDGDLWVAPDGKITFRGRHARLDMSSTATFGKDGVPLVEGVTPEHDTHRLTNIVRVELANGDVFEVTDTSSVEQYGRRVDSVRDVALTDIESEALAAWDVFRFRSRNIWLSGLQVEVSDEDDLETVLQLDRGDLVDVVAVLGDTETTITGHLETVAHTIEVGRWVVTFSLSPYFGAGPWFTLDDATLGVLDDGNRLAP